MKKFLILLCVCGCLAVTPLFADTFGLNFNSPEIGGQLGNGPFTLGWSFTVGSQALTVTDLGVFDQDGAPLLESHEVGIWDSQGVLVAHAIVGAGTNNTLEADSGGQLWRDAVATGSLVLNAGGTYTIGATWNSLTDNMIFSGALYTTSGITYNQNAFIAGGFADPTNTTGDTGSYFGPNFEYNTGATVPEPASLVLFGIGAFGIGLAGLRKARRKAN